MRALEVVRRLLTGQPCSTERTPTKLSEASRPFVRSSMMPETRPSGGRLPVVIGSGQCGSLTEEDRGESFLSRHWTRGKSWRKI